MEEQEEDEDLDDADAGLEVRRSFSQDLTFDCNKRAVEGGSVSKFRNTSPSSGRLFSGHTKSTTIFSYLGETLRFSMSLSN